MLGPLEHLRHIHATTLLLAGGIWPRDGLVFTTRIGRAIEPRAVNRRFDLRCTKAGVRRIRVHDTRRTYGSLLAALDVHPRVAMQILRHSKISITMEIYTMMPDKDTLAALKRLSDALLMPGCRAAERSAQDQRVERAQLSARNLRRGSGNAANCD